MHQALQNSLIISGVDQVILQLIDQYFLIMVIKQLRQIQTEIMRMQYVIQILGTVQLLQIPYLKTTSVKLDLKEIILQLNTTDSQITI